MPKASDLTTEKRFFGMFVGKSGSGKTVAGGSFPKPLDILDFDGRVRGLLGAPWIDRSQISYDAFPPDDKEMLERLNKKLELYQAYARNGEYAKLPKTIQLSSLTSECFAMLTQAIPLTHSKAGAGKGKYLGITAMAGPEDYGFEATNTYNILSFLRSVPIENVIVDAHMVDRFGKADPENPFAESVVVGEKLSVRDKIGENVMIYFDHCFRFNKYESAGKERFVVKFRGDLPYKTSYAKLPMGDVDVTGVNFYETLMKMAGDAK